MLKRQGFITVIFLCFDQSLPHTFYQDFRKLLTCERKKKKWHNLSPLKGKWRVIVKLTAPQRRAQETYSATLTSSGWKKKQKNTAAFSQPWLAADVKSQLQWKALIWVYFLITASSAYRARRSTERANFGSLICPQQCWKLGLVGNSRSAHCSRGGSLSLKSHSLPGQWVDFIPGRERCLWALSAGSCSSSVDGPVLAGCLSKCHAVECAHNDVFTKLYAWSNQHLSGINLSDLVVRLHVSAFFSPYFVVLFLCSNVAVGCGLSLLDSHMCCSGHSETVLRPSVTLKKSCHMCWPSRVVQDFSHLASFLIKYSSAGLLVAVGVITLRIKKVLRMS